MGRILLSSAAALALVIFTANAPSKAQVTFESAYAQPAVMVDGIHVGARISREPEIGPFPVVAAHNPHPASAIGRRHRAH